MTETTSPLAPEPNGVFRARLFSVEDADTVVLLVDCNFHTYRLVTITLFGILPPPGVDERAECARWLRQWFDQMNMAVGPLRGLTMDFDYRLQVVGTAGGGRWRGEIWHELGSVSLNEQYIMTNLVRREP